jgi:hypothetical protein
MFDFATDLANLAVPVAAKKNNDAANVILFDPRLFTKRPIPPEGIERLSEGIKREEMPPLNFGPLIKTDGCAFIREAVRTGGKDYSQPMWNLTTLAATFLEHGYKLAHRMGHKHPEYDKETTDVLWERKLRERKEKGLGWPSCNAIQAAGCTNCAACPHLSKRQSPLNLTLPATAQLLANATEAASRPLLWSAAELQLSFSNIPHRRWLYGTYLIRGEITVLAAPGGAGKTALATGMAVELATGTELLGEKIYKAHDLKVLFINGEDGGTEIRRRVLAFWLAHAHKIGGQNLDRLYVAGANDARVQCLSFLRTTDRNFSTIDRSGIDVLEAALETLRPDALILDPLVAFSGGGNMNDNAVMALVIRELKRLAAKFDCAVLIVHHTRKGADDGNAEAISGASATVNLARRAVMPVTMTGDEAKALAVLPSERSRYFKLVDAKSNLAPRSADSPWYQLHGVPLPNPEPPVYPHGDNVQAIARVYLPLPNNGAATGDDQKIRRAILDLVDRGKMIDGQSYPYSPSLAGAQNTRSLLDDAAAPVAKATAPRQWSPGDLKAVTERAIAKMKEEGLLVEEQMPNTGRFRRGRALRVNRSRTPSPDIGSDGSARLDDPAGSGEET